MAGNEVIIALSENQRREKEVSENERERGTTRKAADGEREILAGGVAEKKAEFDSVQLCCQLPASSLAAAVVPSLCDVLSKIFDLGKAFLMFEKAWSTSLQAELKLQSKI